MIIIIISYYYYFYSYAKNTFNKKNRLHFVTKITHLCHYIRRSKIQLLYKHQSQTIKTLEISGRTYSNIIITLVSLSVLNVFVQNICIMFRTALFNTCYK